MGGWLIFIAHALIIAVVPRATCDPGSDELWVGTLVLACLSGGAVWLIGLGMRFGNSLRWFAAAAIPLALYAAAGIAPALLDTTLRGAALCGIAGALVPGSDLAAWPATGLQRAWPAVQLGVLAAGSLQGLRYWGPSRRRSGP